MMTGTRRKDLLDLQSLDKSEIEYLLDTAHSFKEILAQPVKKVPTLRGKKRRHAVLRAEHPHPHVL